MEIVLGLLIVYFSTMILALILGIRHFKVLIFRILSNGYDSERRARVIERIKEKWIRNIPDKKDIANYHWMNSKVIKKIQNISQFYILPVFVFRMSLMFLFKSVKVLWVIPVSFYEVWDFSLIYLAFTIIPSNPFWAFLIIGFILLNHALKIFDFFNPNNKNAEYYFRMPHKLSINDLLHTYFSFIGCFSVAYHYLGLNNKLGASEKLMNFADYLYLSITVMTTVGFGDIKPTDSFARLVFSSQMILGVLLNLLFVSLFMGMWIAIKLDSEKLKRGMND